MSPERIIEAAGIKGLDAVGTGDALHPAWRKAWEDFDGEESGTIIVPSAEVEDSQRIHHLILMESPEGFTCLAEDLVRWCDSLDRVGRPHLSCGGEELAAVVHEYGGLIGPAHAFTPWTSLYRYCDALAECYGAERPDFLELGLSADTSFGAAISGLNCIPFLSNSDAHSPAPHRLGREFTCLDAADATPRAVIDAIRSGRILFNAGLFPELGKYYTTACSRCYRQFPIGDADRNGWRCPEDGGRIVKGVRDRARELSDQDPAPRPPYHHLVPLGEIIQALEGASSPGIKRCIRRYSSLIASLGPEIGILLEIPEEEIGAIDPEVGEVIGTLRRDDIRIQPGGGGRYGSLDITGVYNAPPL